MRRVECGDGAVEGDTMSKMNRAKRSLFACAGVLLLAIMLFPSAGMQGQTPTPTEIPLVAVIHANQNINVRSRPSTDSPVLRVISPDQKVIILGQNDSGTWYHVRLYDYTDGWISAALVQVVGTATSVPTETPFATVTPLPTFASDALTSDKLTTNNQWNPVMQTFDSVDMVLVPSGCFQMGDEGAGGEQCFDQPFWIDRTEVTNEAFVQLKGTAAHPSVWTEANRPRDSLTWSEAADFCALRGGRLPTEAEWEYAARGVDNLAYPWGDNFNFANVVSGTTHTADVGSKPAGASWVGALDMSGNVWEWTSSLFQPYPYSATDGRESPTDTTGARVLRGGSWGSLGDNFAATFRFSLAPSDANRYVGFRCEPEFNLFRVKSLHTVHIVVII